MKPPFISVCIPSYNRPQELLRLLRTIDSNPQETQIVICEDKAPKRLEVRDCVNEFLRETQYDVKYIENDKALDRRFQKINVLEMSLDETMNILFNIRSL